MSHRALHVIFIAACLDMLTGIVFALTEHVSIPTGLYWALATATTVGAQTPHSTWGHATAIIVEVTVIPLFAATFSLVTSGLTNTHTSREAKVLHDCVDMVDAKAQHIIHYHPDIPELGSKHGDAAVIDDAESSASS